MAIEVRLFNSLWHHAGGRPVLELEGCAGCTVRDIVERLGIPDSAIYVAFRNGRNVALLADGDRLAVPVRDGDVVAFSGPVPWSRGYGAPVV